MTDLSLHPSREQVRTVACPACNAPPGQPCLGRRGDRIANHASRVHAVLDLHAPRRRYYVNAPDTSPPHASECLTADELAEVRAVIAQGRARLSGGGVPSRP